MPDKQPVDNAGVCQVEPERISKLEKPVSTTKPSSFINIESSNPSCLAFLTASKDKPYEMDLIPTNPLFELMGSENLVRLTDCALSTSGSAEINQLPSLKTTKRTFD
ncbi:unannotated protein [freshwater metagenome]|uniref:Unannotated protein n=1 Tax=freshwater metagenome TaxID=449393 RepID=A0A6J5Z1P1_9ZZZZ